MSRLFSFPGQFRIAPLLLAFALQGVSTVAYADPASNAALIDEADALAQKSNALAEAGDTAGAIAAMRESLRLQEEQVVPNLPSEVQTLFRLELTEQKLRLVSLYASNGEFTSAVALLEAEIQFHEGLSVPDKHAGQVQGWRDALPGLRANALLFRAKQAMELHADDRDSEALLVLQEILPQLDRATDIDAEQLASVNLLAGRVFAEALAYTEAETRYLRALESGEKAYGPSASELIVCLGELGRLSITRGMPERGAKHLVRAHEIAQATRDPALASTVKDLGMLLWHRGDNAESIVVLQRALALYGVQSDVNALIGQMATQLFLAVVQDDSGRFDDAETTFQQLGTQLETLIAEQPAFSGLKAVYLRRYGVHHLRQGHYEQAEKALLAGIELSKKSAPADSPQVVQQGCDLGEVYWAAGDLARSLEPIGRCFDSREADIARVLATGTEEQKRAFLGSYLVAFQKTMNAQRLGGNDNTRLNRLALTQVLRTKGRVLDAMTSSGLAARTSQNEETRGLMTRLTSVRAQMASLASSGMGSTGDLSRLRDEATTIEAKLGEVDAGFRAATRTIDLASVQQKLTSDDVLVEIVEYRPLDASYRKADPELRYLAYVVHREGEPRAFDLGPATPIDEAVNALRAVLRHPEQDVAPAARQLHSLVMAPLVTALAGKTHVFLAPDGALNTVPFAALVNANGFLVEQYDFTYLTSGRDLLRFGAEPPASGPLVVYANPEFGAAEGNVSGGNTKLSKVVFQQLPGTQAEADALHELFPDAVVNTGNDASEAAVKRVARPFALHLATHGYFLPTTSLSNLSGPNGEALDLQAANERLALAENPLVRSGLAFAGATGLRGQAGEDGVLTALEASSLDLTGTQLVVLSACQTAEGEVSQGEGVYGLRRSLTVAGAEALVMSLWSVDDEATSYLMRGYYRRLKEGMGRSAALRDVQRVLAASEPTRHPYYWAAFIPSGNPGAIVVPPPTAATPATPTPNSEASEDSASHSGDSDDNEEDSSSDGESEGDWPTATPNVGASIGAVHLALEGNSGQPKFAGTPVYLSMDFSLFSAAWDEDFGNTSRGVVIYDRLGANLGWIALQGNAVATLNWDYSLLLGYRAEYLGVFVGARWGSGTVVVDDSDFTNSGGYFPPAARIELPWFWESRISALGYYGAITDKREVLGVDLRIPLGGPSVWLQAGFNRLDGRVSQDNHAWMVPISLGFSGDD